MSFCFLTLILSVSLLIIKPALFLDWPTEHLKAEPDSKAQWTSISTFNDTLYFRVWSSQNTTQPLTLPCQLCLCYLTNEVIPEVSTNITYQIYPFIGQCDYSEKLCIVWNTVDTPEKKKSFMVSLSDRGGNFGIIHREHGMKYMEVAIPLTIYEKHKSNTRTSPYDLKLALSKIDYLENDGANDTLAKKIINMKLIRTDSNCKDFIEFQNAQVLPSLSSTTTTTTTLEPETRPFEVTPFLKLESEASALKASTTDNVATASVSRPWLIALGGVITCVIWTILYAALLHSAFYRKCCFSNLDSESRDRLLKIETSKGISGPTMSSFPLMTMTWFVVTEPLITSKDLYYLETQIFPYYLIISKIFSFLALCAYPVLIYAIWSKSLTMANGFRALATYTHSFGSLLPLVFLIAEPLGIPQLYIIYSSGLISSLNGTWTFGVICIIVISITHSIHGLCLSVFYCYHMSLLKCDAWFKSKTKLIIVVGISWVTVESICIFHCFVLSESDETLRDLTKEYPILSTLRSAAPSMIAFSMNGTTPILKAFIIYTFIVSILFLAFCLFLYCDYMKYRSKQNQQLSAEMLKTIQILRISYRIRILITFVFRIFPGFLFFIFVFVIPSIPGTFVCATILTMGPFFDIIIEIFSVKAYRKKLLTVLRYRKKLSIALNKIILPSNNSHSLSHGK